MFTVLYVLASMTQSGKFAAVDGKFISVFRLDILIYIVLLVILKIYLSFTTIINAVFTDVCNFKNLQLPWIDHNAMRKQKIQHGVAIDENHEMVYFTYEIKIPLLKLISQKL